MGRHRDDPRGAGQFLAIAGAVLLLIALVVLGGFFLYRSLPGTSSAVLDDSGEVSNSESTGPEDAVLYVRAVGEATELLIRETGGQVLTDTTLQQGQYVSFDNPSMEVRIADPDEVEVYVNGEMRDVSGEPGDLGFSVRAQ